MNHNCKALSDADMCGPFIALSQLESFFHELNTKHHQTTPSSQGGNVQRSTAKKGPAPASLPPPSPDIRAVVRDTHSGSDPANPYFWGLPFLPGRPKQDLMAPKGGIHLLGAESYSDKDLFVCLKVSNIESSANAVSSNHQEQHEPSSKSCWLMISLKHRDIYIQGMIIKHERGIPFLTNQCFKCFNGMVRSFQWDDQKHNGSQLSQLS